MFGFQTAGENHRKSAKKNQILSLREKSIQPLLSFGVKLLMVNKSGLFLFIREKSIQHFEMEKDEEKQR